MCATEARRYDALIPLVSLTKIPVKEGNNAGDWDMCARWSAGTRIWDMGKDLFAWSVTWGEGVIFAPKRKGGG